MIPRFKGRGRDMASRLVREENNSPTLKGGKGGFLREAIFNEVITDIGAI